MSKRRSAAAVWAEELGRARNAPAPHTDESRQVLESAIAEITEQLKGPMHNAIRLDLVDARFVLRKQLARLLP